MRRRPRRILDAHHHFWDLKAGHYPWLDDEVDPDFFLGDYAAFRKERMLPAGYREAACDFNVVGTVHCEAERDRNDQVGETLWLAELNRRDGLPSAIVGHVWFDDPRCEELLAAHRAASPLVRGIRSKPVTAKRPQDMRRGGPRSMQDEAWLRGFALLDKYDLSWDLRVPCWHLAEATEVAKAFPHTPIVLNHTGFPWDRSDEGLRAWRAGMETLASCPNVWLKVSELGVKGMQWTVEGNRGVVRDAIAIFGLSRCMFATNWPVCTLTVSYRDLVDGICDILADLDDDAFDAFFCRNAARFYRIELAGT
ncbi:amidohydrolase family protein [Xanthobacteraceae bacterium Astr-EGSB]|uniref:amidohydrolase family protein n=1 Tax=Astrobacterium formosum TaxID=3069710 RepID=UPI0027B5745A|nr:amidohydrolase family protein [Xanthobacteraceae bacterium Astr-EGSB]